MSNSLNVLSSRAHWEICKRVVSSWQRETVPNLAYTSRLHGNLPMVLVCKWCFHGQGAQPGVRLASWVGACPNAWLATCPNVCLGTAARLALYLCTLFTLLGWRFSQPGGPGGLTGCMAGKAAWLTAWLAQRLCGYCGGTPVLLACTTFWQFGMQCTDVVCTIVFTTTSASWAVTTDSSAITILGAGRCTAITLVRTGDSTVMTNSAAVRAGILVGKAQQQLVKEGLLFLLLSVDCLWLTVWLTVWHRGVLIRSLLRNSLRHSLLHLHLCSIHLFHSLLLIFSLHRFRH